MFPIGRILAASLLLLATIPALLAAWLFLRAGNQAVEALAGKLLTEVALVVQTGSEAHLRQVHDVLNGLVAERPAAPELRRMRAWLRSPELFEPAAFALVRQTPDVSQVHVANLRGDYLGVAPAEAGVRILVRKAGDPVRSAFDAMQPGDHSRPAVAPPGPYEPRSAPWYVGAVMAKDRVFSPVQVSAGRRELVVSLSQPVYDEDGGAAGVLGAELGLQRLTDILRTQRISAHGAAYVFDAKGALIAGSAGDALFDSAEGQVQRRSPGVSANPVIRASFAALQALRAGRTQDTVAMDTSLRRVPYGDESLLVVQRPFGEALGLPWTLVVAAPESDFTADLRHDGQLALGVMAALIVLGALIAFAVAHGLGRRLGRLSLAAAQLGRGEVPVIESGTRIREVHDLSLVLHDSARQLQAYRQEVEQQAGALRQANETLEDRVAQRTAQLAASREEALAAARAKAAFLATMSHEIRTPLNGVVGMSTLLAETRLDAEQRDYLQTIRISSDQLLAVINDILDFSKIESGKLDLEAEPLSVRGAVEEACDIAAPRAREKGLELIVDVPEHGSGAVPAAILGDITRLRQVLINLVNNAVKFTASGEVAVHARQLAADDGQGRCVLEFRITDTGIGIAPERQQALFEAFTQVDASTTRKYGGTGLGLAICKRLVELMGGTIGVESAAGQGATFWFTVAAPVTQLEEPAGAGQAGALSSVGVLVVDDHATNVRILTRQLQLWGMDVASASSGADALRWLAQAPRLPALIVTDMHMPEMDGVAFARAVRADPRLRALRLVLLSSGFMPAGDENAQLFDARLLKPARQNQLFETLSRCLRHEVEGRGAPQRPEDKKHVTVLVADDNAVNLKVACAMLFKLGYEVRTAVDGREAVEATAQAAATGRPLGAILMDVNMPDVDGLEATRQIQAVWGERSPPIIALTAAASAEDRARCEAAGMDDYLTKPLQVAALAQALEKWLAPGPMTAASAAAPGPAVLAEGAPARPPEEDGPLMDFARLEEFKEFDDEELSMTRQVVELFVADAPERLAAVEAAVAAGDAQALGRAAHALKGAASNVGAVALSHAASALEADARAGLPPDAAAAAERLRELWDRTRAALASWP
ncbi:MULTISPECIES: response regulator [Ramlibacter]|uniref:Virulence sensor protein BvgS n=1 Tax=Ramlibacter pinisoli TaxID=2682844 RepID=A0A6N8J3F6_9BURK|nr:MULTISPECIES: response regulator [Ramlibacter]MBA2962814.1 response regulator [Ramlibacter sp. CGMCC 1.13660]MVQ32756.1 response regulator [Ramlibacter pinisoli]